MSALGPLLELIYRAHEATSSFVAEYRDWGNPKPSYQLVIDPARAEPRWDGAGPWPHESELTRRIWYAYPDRLRVEVSRRDELVRLGVRNEARWWRWNASDGAADGILTPDNGVLTIPRLLDPTLLAPTRLLERLQLQPTGTAERAGRSVACAVARPRRTPNMPAGVSYELEFDAQHGTLLRRALLEDTIPVQISEVLDIRYNVNIDQDRFGVPLSDDDLAAAGCIRRSPAPPALSNGPITP